MPQNVVEAYVSLDNKTVIPISEDLSQTNTLKEYFVGQPFIITNSLNYRTYICQTGETGKLISPKLLAEVGGYDAVLGPDGKIYISGDHIYVYDVSGNLLKEIKLPEGPYSIAFEGKNGKRMYICAGSSLYLYENSLSK